MGTGDRTETLPSETLPGERTASSPSPVSSPSSALEDGAPAPPVHPGDCLGRYTLRESIGRGAFGEVFAAHDPDLDRTVAVKVLRSGLSPEARARFQREAQAMARLSHPHVVAVYDVGTVAECVYVAMERVEGPTLATWLHEKPRGWREVVDVMLQAGRGLEAAHRAGLVHRDFKPANVLVGERVRVADFGLARAASDTALAEPGASVALHGVVTQTGARIGTPAYMAPEQAAGGPPSTQSDQYSFAVTFHEALCGVRPTGACGELAPHACRIPARLKRVVQRATSTAPADRYPSMSELLRDLGRVTVRDVLLGMDYSFRQRAMPLLALVAIAGQLVFYFLDGTLLGMRDSLAVRSLAAAAALPVLFFPRDAPLTTAHKLTWEIGLAFNLFVFPYLYLLNGMNKYWYVSIVFIGVTVGFLAKTIFIVPFSALTFVAAGLAFSFFHGAMPGEIRVVAETYVVFIVTALLFSVAALGLETTLRNAARG